MHRLRSHQVPLTTDPPARTTTVPARLPRRPRPSRPWPTGRGALGTLALRQPKVTRRLAPQSVPSLTRCLWQLCQRLPSHRRPPGPRPSRGHAQQQLRRRTSPEPLTKAPPARTMLAPALLPRRPRSSRQGPPGRGALGTPARRQPKRSCTALPRPPSPPPSSSGRPLRPPSLHPSSPHGRQARRPAPPPSNPRSSIGSARCRPSVQTLVLHPSGCNGPNAPSLPSLRHPSVSTPWPWVPLPAGPPVIPRCVPPPPGRAPAASLPLSSRPGRWPGQPSPVGRSAGGGP